MSNYSLKACPLLQLKPFDIFHRVSPTQPATGCGPNGHHLLKGVDWPQLHSVVSDASCQNAPKHSTDCFSLIQTSVSTICSHSLISHRGAGQQMDVREQILLCRFCPLPSPLKLKSPRCTFNWCHDNPRIKTLLTLSVNEHGSPANSEGAALSMHLNEVSHCLLSKSTLMLRAPFYWICLIIENTLKHPYCANG